MGGQHEAGGSGACSPSRYLSASFHDQINRDAHNVRNYTVAAALHSKPTGALGAMMRPVTRAATSRPTRNGIQLRL